MKEKGNLHPWKPPNQQKHGRSQRELQEAEKSMAAGLRSRKQSERRTDHLNHWHRHHRLRCLVGGWVLRLRLWRSVPGSGLGLVVWSQPKGLGSSMLLVGECYAKGWGVESHGRGNPGEGLDLQERQGATVGKGRGGGAGCHRKLLGPQYAHFSTISQKPSAPSLCLALVPSTRKSGPTQADLALPAPSSAPSAQPAQI